MPRQPRQLSASGIYHIMCRGIDRQQLFYDDLDNTKFMSALSLVQSDDFEVLAYCLMGNHFHLLVRTAKDSIEHMELAMKRLGIRYANHYNQRYTRLGPVFQGRYKSVPVQGTRYFLRVLRYIHRNPVKAGLCRKMQDYSYSSYIDYFATRDACLCPVRTEYALRLMDADTLRTWHEQPEENPVTLDIEDARVPDVALAAIIERTAGCPPALVHTLPPKKLEPILRRLVREEGAHIPQLARLTGLSRGLIQRCVI